MRLLSTVNSSKLVNGAKSKLKIEKNRLKVQFIIIRNLVYSLK